MEKDDTWPESHEGVLLVDKPRGPTSHDATQKVKRAMKAFKAGHLGSLDPMATGLLLVCLNGATKIARFMKCHRKEYIAEMTIGVQTDTMDADGKVTDRRDLGDLSEGRIREAFEAFRGAIKQRPPPFSAVKIGGTPLHRLARRGIMVEAPERTAHVYELEITGLDLPRVMFRALVSAGTYIRALAADVGVRLGVGAHLSSLRRTSSGPFRVENSIPLNELETGPGARKAYGMIISAAQALVGWPEITVKGDALKKLSNGNALTAGDFSSGMAAIAGESEGEMAKAVDEKGRLVAVVKKITGDGGDAGKDGVLWHPARVWNY